MNSPLVSCIMPTANREVFIVKAIENFLAQDYPNKELVIVDDGFSSIEHLLPADERIKYHRIEGRHFIGAKRNIANLLAQGEIILHFDDDDWYAPDWITRQVKELTESGADITGLSELYFYNPEQEKCWKYIYPANSLPWIAGATMAYRKVFWHNNRFQNIQVGEDNQFVWNVNCQVHAHNYIEGFISILHSKNTSPKYVNDASRWHPCEVSEIKSILERMPLLTKL